MRWVYRWEIRKLFPIVCAEAVLWPARPLPPSQACLYEDKRPSYREGLRVTRFTLSPRKPGAWLSTIVGLPLPRPKDWTVRGHDSNLFEQLIVYRR